uniref:YgeF n=6 Tax=Escherichia coli TaxID=562 RepID=A0A160EH79_ECOLX|nr:YgeF [Escherichia coli]ANB45619.1 YgeF [Escherichia coli]ANB45641.1 YgeF [Escherichia coli]ANB45662.1 YgeF [Escherichia coli]ANB45684.1 YgeF [Escherichia coli]
MKPRNINNSLPLQPLVPDQENKNKKNEEKYVNPVKITMRSGLNYIEQESLEGKYLTHDLSIKIADISEEIIQQAILSAMSIYKFPITDDLMSMATNELIKLAKIENNLDLNKFSTICTDVLSPLVTRHNKEKKPDDLLPFAKIPFLIFIEKMEIDNMNQGHAY